MNDFFHIVDTIEPTYVMEGAGVRLKRSFSPQVANHFDPFLLFDHFAFNDPIEGAGIGFPMHPHRGIETVTYMLAGRVDHHDSLGNRGQIGPGDIQWMTAGGGILHEEMPRIGPDRAINGFQLWINLPAALKMIKPHYQAVIASKIPKAEGKGWQARVITGQVGNIHGWVDGIAIDPIYLDVSLEPGSVFDLPVPPTNTALAYVFEGQGLFGDQTITAVQMVLLAKGDTIRFQTEEQPARFLIMAGEPIKEPIFPYGPFVMNTAEEIQQALIDLRNDTFVRG